MTTPATPRVRASDAEREEVVELVQRAGGDGRLTLDEVEQRLAAVYAAKFRDELAPFTEDLPDDRPTGPPRFAGRRPTGPLAVHAAVVAVLAVVLIVRWVITPAVFFWPAFPLFWLAMSLLVHARVRMGGPRRWSAR